MSLLPYRKHCCRSFSHQKDYKKAQEKDKELMAEVEQLLEENEVKESDDRS
jgi:hypothetical protein